MCGFNNIYFITLLHGVVDVASFIVVLLFFVMLLLLSMLLLLFLLLSCLLFVIFQIVSLVIVESSARVLRCKACLNLN